MQSVNSIQILFGVELGLHKCLSSEWLIDFNALFSSLERVREKQINSCISIYFRGIALLPSY